MASIRRFNETDWPSVWPILRAIFEAACELAKEGQAVTPEVIIPLVGHVNELKNQKSLVIETAEQVMKAVRRSGPPKQMLVVSRSSVSTRRCSPFGEMIVMPPFRMVATQTLPSASTAILLPWSLNEPVTTCNHTKLPFVS